MRTVRFELTPEEWQEAQVAHLDAPANQSQLRRFRIVVVGAALVMGLLAYVGGGTYSALPWLLFGGIWVALSGPLMRFAQRRLAKRLSKQGGMSHGTFGPHEVSISEAGISDVTPVSEVHFKWAAVDRVVEAKGNFLVYLGPHALMIIPASAFQDAGELRAFGSAFLDYASGSPGLEFVLTPRHGTAGNGEISREEG